MDFGGILAGAMAGGGKAIQQNAQSQLEKQRKQALIELEQKRADQRAAATAQADAAQAAIDRQAELDRIAAEGDQERKTRERQAELDNQYGAGSDRPAKVQEIEYLTREVTGGDQNLATQIAYRTSGDFSYGDAYELVSDSVERMSPSMRRDMTPEKVRERADALFQRVREMDSFGGAQGNRPSGMMSLGSSSSMSTMSGDNALPLSNPASSDRPDPFGIRN